MNNTTIRKAAHSDLHQVSRLFDAYRVFYGKQSDILAAENFIGTRLKLSDSEIFVAEVDGVLAGFTQLYPLYSSVRMKKLWLLNDLFVDGDYRGRGISVMLIDAAKQLCYDSGACGMYLETAKSNDIGNALYPRTGFSLNTEYNFYEWETAE